jgi:hypothetical protein
VSAEGPQYSYNPCLPHPSPEGYPNLLWKAQDPQLGHLIGRADGDGWSANTAQDRPGWLQYGPYTNTVPVGLNTAIFSLAIDNNTVNNDPIVTIDINDATTQTQLAYYSVSRRDWLWPMAYHTFPLSFNVDPARAGHSFEFRVYWLGRAYVKEQGVTFVHLDPVSESDPAPACVPRSVTCEDYCNQFVSGLVPVDDGCGGTISCYCP